MKTAAEYYDWLMGGGEWSACDAFDAHVIAAIVAMALAEAQAEHRPVLEGVGLDGAEFVELVGSIFPHAAPMLMCLTQDRIVTPTEEEFCLRQLLTVHATMGDPFETRLAAMIARRALRPNHLWQDLGLRQRRELSWLMEKHFEPLATRNRNDMKWKKFLYRQVCLDDGFRLCTVPSCRECDDFDSCFGAEGGESLLARSRRALETAG